MALRTKQIPIDDVTPHPDNVNEGDVGAITESLGFHGQYRAIVVSEVTGHILAGNHTWMAAKALGWDKITAHLLPDLTPEQERRIMLADNQYARLASTDEQGLVQLLTRLTETPDGLLGTGFDGDDLDAMVAELTPQSPGRDTSPSDPPTNPVTQLGDRFKVGPHVVVCGDARNPEVYPDGFDLLWTDPPYGVAIGDKNKHLDSLDSLDRGSSGRVTRNLDNDTLSVDEMQRLWTDALTAALAAASPNTAYYITGPSGDLLYALMTAIRDSGWQQKHLLVWDKGNSTLGRTDYHYRHEPVLYGWNEKHTWYGDRSQHSGFNIPRPSASPLHPTMKPVELIEPMITNSTPQGGLVVDPFAGSGSTALAAHNLNRSAWLIEHDPAYVDVILKRLTDHDPTLTPEPL